MLGKEPLVFVTAPGALGSLLEADRAGAARRGVLPAASPHSPFGADGAEHRAIRAAMEPAFAAHDPERIAAIAAEHVARWPAGRPFRALPRMRALATDLFVRLTLRIEDAGRARALVAAIRRMLWTPGNPPLAVPDEGGAIVAEVLRLRPSASAALRELTAPAEIDGYALPAGTDVALPSPLLHRDPEAFADPDAFRPQRAIPDGAPYFPFGAGARRCVGEPLARAELRAALPVVLGRRRLTAVWPRAERMVVRGTVLVPHRGALLVAS